MALSRKRKRNARAGTVFPVFVAVAAVSAVVALVYFSVSQQPAVYDEDTLCLVGEPPSAVLAIVIDGTDGIPSVIARKAVSGIKEAVNMAAPNTLVNLYTISASAGESMSPAVSLCKPRDGSDADELTECPGCMETRFEARFERPLRDILDSLMGAEPANQSPILESIKGAVVDSFVGANQGTGKKLLIVSDLLQHSSFYSFYGGVPSLEDFETALVSEGIGSMDLLGAEVHFLVVPRQRSADSFKEVAWFWRQFLTNQNAGLGSTWEPL